MRLGRRAVVRIWDRFTVPNKWKRHLFISDQLFLRINSRPPPFLPYHTLPFDQNSSFLDHDSHVELQQLVRHIAYEINRSEFLGTMSVEQARLLVDAARQAVTLTLDQKDLIAAGLLSDVE